MSDRLPAPPGPWALTLDERVQFHNARLEYNASVSNVLWWILFVMIVAILAVVIGAAVRGIIGWRGSVVGVVVAAILALPLPWLGAMTCTSKCRAKAERAAAKEHARWREQIDRRMALGQSEADVYRDLQVERDTQALQASVQAAGSQVANSIYYGALALAR